MHIYVCAPYSDAAFVRVVHERLVRDGFRWTSRWAEEAHGPEDLSSLSDESRRRAYQQNDSDLRGSDVALVCARHGSGGEMFAEARLACEWSKAVIWTGNRQTLSAFRPGVLRVGDVDAALALLDRMRPFHAEGARGHLLASLVSGAE